MGLELVRCLLILCLFIETSHMYMTVSMHRKVVKPFTFSNGVHLPIGTSVVVPSAALHCDSELYTDPNVFDAFRFCKADPRGIEKSQLVTTDVTYVAFGHGRHAWFAYFSPL